MASDARIGTRLAGYRIESVLGRGGMSVVYLAEHLRLGRKVALKVLAAELAQDESFRERFVRESRIAAGLDHPNIVPIYEADEAEGQLFIAMRYVRGTDLEQLVRAEGALDLHRTLSILAQVADALDAAHVEDLVHRDVKPANILIESGSSPGAAERAYLSDFGVTKRTTSSQGLTGAGLIVGTLDYVAPEQIDGREVDGRADIYALGCVLFRCLTGRVPFPRDSAIGVLWAHVSDPPPLVTDARPDLPAHLDVVVVRAMAKSPDRRPSSCTEMVTEARSGDQAHAISRPMTDLVSMKAGGEAPGRRGPAVASPRATEPQRVRRRRVGAIALGAAVLVGAGIAGIILASRGGSPSGTPSANGASTTGPAVRVRAQIKQIDPTTNRVIDSISAPIAHPLGLGVTDEAIWVTTPQGVVPVDRDGRVGDLIDLNVRPSDIGVGAGGVWIVGNAVSGAGEVVEIDPLSRRIAAVLDLGTPADRVAVAPNAVWVLGSDPPSLTRIDPATASVVRTVALPESSTDIAVGEGGVWVADAVNNRVFRVDIATYLPDPPIDLPGPVEAVAAGAHGVWALDPADDWVFWLDPEQQTVGQPIRVAQLPIAITAGNLSVWVAGRDTVSRIGGLSKRSQPIPVPGAQAVAVEHVPGRTLVEVWVLARTRSA